MLWVVISDVIFYLLFMVVLPVLVLMLFSLAFRWKLHFTISILLMTFQ